MSDNGIADKLHATYGRLCSVRDNLQAAEREEAQARNNVTHWKNAVRDVEAEFTDLTSKALEGKDDE